MSLVLGIETSCDETSAGIVADGRRVLSNIVGSQVDLHARYGGVVPEIASRAHVEAIEPIISRAMDAAGVGFRDLTAIAVTEGPGLVGSLLVGVTAAKAIALVHDLPLVGVDHIESHATSAALICDEPPWPAIALVVSGGHTSLYLVRDFLDIQLLGQTIDDAAGEAFDKVAALLELGFPGGPALDKLARQGNPAAYNFPRAFLHERERLAFSFSGVKTAVMYQLFGPGNKYGSTVHLSEQQECDLAASFQAAVVEVLVEKTLTAARREGVGTVVVGGGVAANSGLRAGLQAACDAAGLRLVLTPMAYCTDNAAMIAAQGTHLLAAGRTAGLDLEPRYGLRRPARTDRAVNSSAD